jgi:hypothetical protein
MPGIDFGPLMRFARLELRLRGGPTGIVGETFSLLFGVKRGSLLRNGELVGRVNGLVGEN